MRIAIIIILFLTSCSTSLKTYVVVGHISRFDGDTINIVKRTDKACLKSPVYPIGTIICKGRLKIQ